MIKLLLAVTPHILFQIIFEIEATLKSDLCWLETCQSSNNSNWKQKRRGTWERSAIHFRTMRRLTRKNLTKPENCRSWERDQPARILSLSLWARRLTRYRQYVSSLKEIKSLVSFNFCLDWRGYSRRPIQTEQWWVGHRERYEGVQNQNRRIRCRHPVLQGDTHQVTWFRLFKSWWAMSIHLSNDNG